MSESINIPSTTQFFMMQKNDQKKEIVIRPAIVVAIDLQGKAIVSFAGEDHPSRITPKYLPYYVPKVGDLLLILDGFVIGGARND